MTEAAGAGAPVPPGPDPASPALAPAGPVDAVDPGAAAALAPPLDPARLPALELRVEGFLTALLSAPARSAELARQAAAVRGLGEEELRRAVEAAGRVRQVLTLAPAVAGLTEDAALRRALRDLRALVADLDPTPATVPRRFLGVFPYGDPVGDYFRRYPSVQDPLDAVLRRLREGRAALDRADAALHRDRQHLWSLLGRLTAYTRLTEQLDARLTGKVAALAAADPGRAEVLHRDVLVPLRRRHADLLDALALTVQGYLVLDTLTTDHRALATGLERVEESTVATLRTAARATAALTDLTLVLDRVLALREAPDEPVPPSGSADLAGLRAALAGVEAAVDAVEAFAGPARDALAASLTALEPALVRTQQVLDGPADERPAPR